MICPAKQESGSQQASDKHLPDELRSSLTVADVLRRYVPDLLERSPGALTARQQFVLQKLMDCRTDALGGNAYCCLACGNTHFACAWCNDRHCPTCNGPRRAKWLDKMIEWSLPTTYYHVVQTLPHRFCALIRCNQKLMYRLLMQASTQAILSLGEETLGAQLAVVMTLHTWGQRVNDHPHTHTAVSAGGLSLDGERWLDARDPQKFFSRRALSRRFRDLFIKGLERLVKRGELTMPQRMASIKSVEDLRKWLEDSGVMRQNWVVSIQPPPDHCQGPEAVLKYLASYVAGTAIGNQRMLKDDGKWVTISVKDYRTGGQTQQRRMRGIEFVKRYAQHILPKGIRRVRYAGLYSPRRREELTDKCRQLIRRHNPTAPPAPPPAEEVDPDPFEGPEIPEHQRERKCIKCGEVMDDWGRMSRARFDRMQQRRRQFAQFEKLIESTPDLKLQDLSLPLPES